jgi:asparagine synthase (glutamine-hydrolysing)
VTSARLPIPFAGTLGADPAPRAACKDGAPPDAPLLGVHHRGDRSVTWFGHPRLVGDAVGRGPGEDLGVRLLDAWQRGGDAVLDALAGPFLIAFHDVARGDGLIAVDRFSTYPLFWAQSERIVTYGPTPARVLELAGRAASLDLGAILAYTYFHAVPAPMSIFGGVSRLENGTALRVRDGRGEVFRYWSPEFEERRPFDFAVEREAFMGALRDGVRASTDGLARDQVGCFLSGGTDSSTIAGLVTRRFDGPARTFSIGFDVAGYDESEYSRLAARHFGTDHTEYLLTADDAYEGIQVIADAFEQPFGNSSAVPTYFCARLGRDRGIVRMLGGDGGDELYGGNERYAKQAVFALYGSVPSIVRRAIIEPLLAGPMSRFEHGLVGKARSYVEQANQPLPDRMQSRYNLLNWLGVENVFTKAFLGEVEPGSPLEHERDVWRRCRASAQVNRLLAYDFKFTLADNDLPKVTRMCHAAGVDVAFPMLERAVLEHSLRLAPGQKLKGRTLRHFFRESLRGYLPDAIIDKSKHGFGMPFGAWVMTHPRLRALADDALASLAARQLVREPFLLELRGRLAAGHTGYYGTMVWVLTMLELWLRRSPAADFRL